MRFSPDKQPRRPRKPAPKEILDISRAEEKFSFDPGLDIPAETWKLIDEALVTVPEGKEVEFFLEVKSLASVLALLSPERLSRLRENTRLKAKVLEYCKKSLDSEGVNINILPDVILIFPDFKTELVDLSHPSLVRNLQAFIGKRRRRMIDFESRNGSVLNLEGLLALDSLPMSEVVAQMRFLKAFFPDGGKLIEDSMHRAGITPEKLLIELSQYPTHRENRFHLMSYLFLLFPNFVFHFKQEPDNKEFLQQLRHYVRSGVSEKSKLSEYAKLTLAYAVLTADSASFDESGVRLHRNQGEVQQVRPLPERSET